MITKRANDIRRLNEILRLPGVNLGALNDDAWNALLDGIYFAVFGQRGRRERLKKAVESGFDSDLFHNTMDRAGLRDAQVGLQVRLPILRRHKAKDSIPPFELKGQWMYIAAGKEGFEIAYASGDCPTTIYSTLVALLLRSKVTQRDILNCANPRCGAFFVSLRKPHAGQRNFCSQRCGSLIAARDYRSKKGKMLKAKEKERSRKRYEARRQKQLPGQRLKKRAHQDTI